MELLGTSHIGVYLGHDGSANHFGEVQMTQFLQFSVSTLVLIIAAIFAFLIFLLIRMVAEAKHIHVRKTTLYVHDLDERLVGTRIFFGSDIHAGPPLQRKGMEKLVRKINNLHPDIILLGGDYVGGNFRGTEYFYPALKELSAPDGVFAVVGNHDNWETGDRIDTLMKEAGVTLLRNKNVRILHNGAPINIAGVDDVWTGNPDLLKTAEGIEQSEFAIMLSHNPDVFAEGLPNDNKGGFDLAMAGHTHGGQITGFGKLAYAPTEHGKRYLNDWRFEDSVPILVSNGIGCNSVPIRFYAPAEMHMIELARGPQRIEDPDTGSTLVPED